MLAAFAPPALADPLRLVAIGDSLTAGYGLAGEDGFVPQLDRGLAGRGHDDVEVVNMGVSGDTTAGGRARLDWALADGADAVLLALGANDMLRGIDPGVARGNLDAMLARLAEDDLPVLIAGMIAPANYGPDYKEAFDGMYPELARDHGALLYPFFMEGVIGEPGLMQPDGLHPNAAGVLRMVEEIGPKVLELIARVEP
ncbi:MAG TPA: arylesterase [Thermohalobaculum sp.]|nr:arylesterase [Thermohalobaculum sp.]